MSANSLKEIDIKSNEFHHKMLGVNEIDSSRLMKDIAIIINKRMAAVELELKAAVMYHDKLFYKIEEHKNITNPENLQQ